MQKKAVALLMLALGSGLGFCDGDATTKGLNQIVTPDIQPLGQLSLSLQYQHPLIGNSFQTQQELGITKNFEIATFQGYKPGAQLIAAEFGIVQQKEFLVSAGFLNWSTRGNVPQTFLESGYYKGNARLIAGAQRIGNRTLAVIGGSYQANNAVLIQLDYLTGRDNFATAGFTYSITKNLSFNPALYVANAAHHRIYPYAVLSWTVTAWKG